MKISVSRGNKKYTRMELNSFTIGRLNAIFKQCYRPPTPPKDDQVRNSRSMRISSTSRKKTNKILNKNLLIEKILKFQSESI